MGGEVRIALCTDADLVNARAEGRAMAEELGFPRPDPTLDRHRHLGGGTQYRQARRAAARSSFGLSRRPTAMASPW